MRLSYRRIVSFLGSRTFFIVIMGLFLVSAFWIALSARYPMAFDEEYHLGLIKLHALQWNPIFTNQPAGIAQYGALTTDPSYLFHWLMSFPYRVMSALKMSQMDIVIVLRFMNVLLFTSSIYFMRILLLKTKTSRAVVHIGLLFFVLIPVVPSLAATINYDNLQNLLLTLGLLFVVRFREKLQKKTYDIQSFFAFMSIGLLASLVKFTFLPFLTAFAAYWLYATIRFALVRKNNLKRSVSKDWRAIKPLKKVVVTTIFIASCALFLNSYAVNIAKYHNPIPQCGQVVDYQRCQAYSPWYRNYLSAISNKKINPNPVLYTGTWIGGMFNRLLFVINGKAPVDNYQNFMSPLLALAVIIICFVGLLLGFKYGWKILSSDGILSIYLFVTLVYVASVWGRNYHDWLHLKQAVAINGRYLVPILPFTILFTAKTYQLLLAKRQKAKAYILGISLFLFLQGGGATSFIYYSSDSWYWDGDHRAQTMNHSAKKIVKPLFLTNYFKALDHIYQ